MAMTVVKLFGETGTLVTGLSPAPVYDGAALPANATPFQPPVWAAIIANRITTAVTIQAICDVVPAAATAVTLAVDINVSDDGIHWIRYVTISLSATTSAGGIGPSDGITLQAPWRYIQANVTAITGANAVGNVLVGVN